MGRFPRRFEIIATLSGRSSPPKVLICGVGERSGRRGASFGIAVDSLWRRNSSSRACSFSIFLLTLPPDGLRSASGSVDLDRRRNPNDVLRVETWGFGPLPFSMSRVGWLSGGEDLPGVRGLEVGDAMTVRRFKRFVQPGEDLKQRWRPGVFETPDSSSQLSVSFFHGHRCQMGDRSRPIAGQGIEVARESLHRSETPVRPEYHNGP